ncbi:MAG: alpha/beta fold hydrolase [Clostridiales bacterium]|nr:alpha/beta fold hydrolase [Clostridiales bacterium]
MKKAIFWFCLGLIIATSFLLAGRQAPPREAEDELIIKARAFLRALDRNDFEAAVTDFDATMMKVSGPDKLAEFWNQVPGQFGAFKRQTAARRDELGPYDIVLVTCEFEKVTLDARVVFDKAGKIAGLQFVPSLPPAKYEPPGYADEAAFEEEEVTVGSGEWKLPGTLALPKGEGPFPAVVLVHGSGPNDRDETLGPNKPFKDLAWGLATNGIAVLRYEKRTRVYGARLIADPKMSAVFTVKEETIDDALEAVRLLQETQGIDRKKIFVLGHSLGGMLIPRIALEGKDLNIAGFIIMAGLTRTWEETYLQQMTYLFSLDGQLSEEDKKQLDEIRTNVAKIQALQESDRGSNERLLHAPPSYWLDLRGYYPPDVAVKIKKPMLILQGSRDYQVTTEDFENWKKVLAGRPDVEFRLYPKLNHLFFEGQGIPTPNEYLQVHGSVAADVIADIATFIKK